MVDTLRIKRRAAGGAAGPPATLVAAELAFNEQDNTLYYGKGNSSGNATAILPIAGDAKAPRVVTTDTPPSSPVVGQLWWETTTGNMYVYYDDGTSTQWVQVGT